VRLVALVAVPLSLCAQIRFEDVTAKSGIEFQLRNGAAGKLHQIELMPGGVAAFDFDNDGCADLFFTNGAALPSLRKTDAGFHNRLYRGHCDFTFTDVTDKAGLAGQGYSMAAATGDYDNDGFADLFVAGVHGNTLYRNRGDGTFEDVTRRAGLAPRDASRDWSISAGWFDYDRDGYLDLFVSNYVHWDPAQEVPCGPAEHRIYCHPKWYAPQSHRLYRNKGDGSFADVSASAGIMASPGKGMGVAFADADNDGWPDVFVANDSAPNQFFRNRKGQFEEAALEAGVAYPDAGKAIAGMGCDFRDFDNDGLPDLVVTGMVNDTFLAFRNLGKSMLFEDFTAQSGLARATVHLTGWSVGVFDFDNDGWKDLFAANSHFPRLERQLGADPELANSVYRGVGKGRFEPGQLPSRKAFYRGSAFADFDLDGRVDAVVTALNAPVAVLRNVSSGNAHWIGIRLKGTASNRQGLGARVRVDLPGGGSIYNHATTSVGYASSSEAVVRFGLGARSSVAGIEVRWPSGRVQRVEDIRVDRVIDVAEQ
jgi:hypothetical protein